MLDKNGKEMKTGDVVIISGAYFKNDNGLWKIEHSPGDANWWGRDYSLRRLNKNGTVSKRKDNICFWPIGIFVNDYYKRLEAKAHNAKFAQIEIVG